MSNYLTVNEAAKLTGKSPSSIRRVIYPIIHDDHQPDRQHIKPNVDEVKKLRLKGENFAWRISEELLRREVPVEAGKPNDDGRAESLHRAAGDVELLTMLRRELDIKNQQITQQSEMLSKQMELISGLSERLREGNILIGSLQNQLTLTDGSSRNEVDIVDTKSAAPPAAKKGSEASKKKPKTRKSFFARIFR